MTVNFYKNSSPENYVTKNISATDSLECELKDNCSIINPVIEVLGTNALNANYMYIPQFSRYYYINDIVTAQYDTLIISGHVDVLMSFQNAILNAQGIVERQQNTWNAYFNDPYVKKLAYPRVQTKKFSKSFSKTPTFILIASGNEVS